ncbi:MAG: tRNA threonylcarbamoyladenosine dehydratase [Desulfotalea sp.]
MARFSRLEALLGSDKLNRLATRTVTIVGIGAVGGHVMEGLARAGIGNFCLVDFDEIEASNINRQLLALESTIGKKKVDLAKARIIEINPNAHVKTLPILARDENMDDIIDPRPDLIIDAIDSLNPKTGLLQKAYEEQIPVISSMGAALRTDPSKVIFGDLFKTHGCPLARHLRKRLRRRGISKGIPCVYSTELVNFDYNQNTPEELADKSQGRQRNILGSMPTIPAIFGLTIANHAILALAEEKITLCK